MNAPDRTKLNEKIEMYNHVLDLIRLNPDKIKICDCVYARETALRISKIAEEIHEELTLQYELEVHAMKASEVK